MAGPETYSGNGHTATIADPENITRDECLALARCGAEQWNAWRREFPSRFVRKSDLFIAIQSSARRNCADFSGVEFNEFVDFFKFEFGAGANFEQTIFREKSDFRFAKFDDGCDFSFSKFLGPTIFFGSTFSGQTQFIATEFYAAANFQSSTFGFFAEFSGANFHGFTTFSNCKYPSNSINFEEANFRHHSVDFSSNSFDQESSKISNSSFAGAHFFGTVNFSFLKFVGATKFSISTLHARNSRVKKCGEDNWLHWETEGRPVTFSQPPWFFNTSFEENVSFEHADFPPATGSETSARAYRVLKQTFSAKQATREEQRFFQLEMAEEAMAATGWRGWLYRAYESLSDFGFSVSRPLIKLVLLPALGALFLYLLCMATAHPELWTTPLAAQPQLASQWLQFTLMNLSPLPDSDALNELRHALFEQSSLASLMAMVVEILQKLLAFTGYFLSGLALRNLFKMK